MHIRKAHPEELSALIAIDDAASALYAQAGLAFEFADDHPFVLAESKRWAEAIAKGATFTATDSLDNPVGFAVLAMVDNAPYLDQLSVHPDYMRQGLGRKLLQSAIRFSADRPLWLTTYSHLPWNKPFYERHGFTQVSQELCSAGIREILALQREALPEPNQRIAMVNRQNEYRK